MPIRKECMREHISGIARGTFSAVANVFCFMLVFPVTIYAAKGGAESGSAVGDSLIMYTNSLKSDINLFLRFIFALAIVLFLLILTLWFLKYIMRLRTSGGGNSSIDVLDIRYIEPKKAVAIIRVLNRVMIIGLADNSISALGELSSEEIGTLNLDKKTESGIFGNILAKYYKKKSPDG